MSEKIAMCECGGYECKPKRIGMKTYRTYVDNDDCCVFCGHHVVMQVPRGPKQKKSERDKLERHEGSGDDSTAWGYYDPYA